MGFVSKNEGRTDQRKNRFIFITLSFVIPFIVIVLALIALRIAPFGDHTLIISDAKGLYINYLSYVGRFVKGLEGFTYSFEKGLGGNMMPHMNGTMSNPLFALMALFSISDYPVAFTLISTLNICVCGLTMYILLAELYGHRRSNLIFSTSYALSGFLVANVFQVIFFTGCQALPLMVLGLKRIFDGKNPLLYILAILYATATSSYFGFTLCVASVVFFFTWLWVEKDALTGKKLSVFINYSISSLCAGLIPIVLWLPAYMGIMGGRADQTRLTDFSFWEKMPFIEIFSKLFTGANSTAQLVNGLPNIFVGLLPVALVILFFLNKNISRRLKAAAATVLGFYLLGFYIIAFDMLLHGGTVTNWFNFRYSYIFSFVLLMIAAYEWQYVDELSPQALKRCLIGLVLALLVVFSKKYEYVMGSEVLLDIALLLVIYLAYRMYRTNPKANPKSTFEAVTLLIVCIGLFLNYTICTKSIQDQGWERTEKDYQATVNAVEPLVSAIQNVDDGFYRMEVNHQLSDTCGNDPMLYGYNGVGHGGSNERNFVREELFKLGVQWFNMRSYYAQGIPAATDALLGIRYLIADQDMAEEKAYIRITDMKKYGLDFGDAVVYDSFKNDYALPIAFVAENSVNALALTDDDLFDNLNRVWQAISGEDRAVFVEEDGISFRSLNLSASREIEAEDARALTRKYDEQASNNAASANAAAAAVQTEKTGGENSAQSDSVSGDANEFHLIMDQPPMFASSVEFSFTAAQDGPVYVYHRGALMPGNGHTEPMVKYMGTYRAGDTVKGYLAVTGDYVNKVTFEEYAGRFRAAYADLDALKAMSRTVTARPSTLEKLKDSHLQGTVTLAEGQELLFTIPWDTGWTCYVDGVKTELTKVLGVFMAAEAAPGEHSYEMVYQPGGMALGIKISLGALVLLLLYMLFGRKVIDRVFVKKAEPAETDETEQENTGADAQTVEEVPHDPV